jgi:1-deoxy-D-xylulose-5-phosphate reductoisomerase
MVEFVDGSVIAQLGATDMRLPIQYAFSYPERWTAPVVALDLTALGPLEFEPPDIEAFPCLALAYRALSGAASLAVVLNAANEVAVTQFLAGRLSFGGIADVIERTLDAHEQAEVTTLAEVRRVDEWARRYSLEASRKGTIETLRFS